MPVKPLIGTTFLFHEKHRNFPRKILPTIDFSAAKICALSAGKAGIFEVTENFCGSAGYWNAVLQFSRFPSANLGTENETTPTGTRAGWLGSICSCRRRPVRVRRLVEIRVGLVAGVHRLVETDIGPPREYLKLSSSHFQMAASNQTAVSGRSGTRPVTNVGYPAKRKSPRVAQMKSPAQVAGLFMNRRASLSRIS